MIIAFYDKQLYDLYTSWKSPKYPKWVISSFVEKINLLKSISKITELNAFKSLNFEKLNNYKKWDYSIRLNKQYRLVFNIWKNWEFEIIEVIEISKHYE